MDECVHGMIPEWCANCKGLKTPEEEEKESDQDIDILIERLNQ